MIVDPFFSEYWLNVCFRNNWELLQVWLTHSHWDHSKGVEGLSDKQVWVHTFEKERGWDGPSNNEWTNEACTFVLQMPESSVAWWRDHYGGGRAVRRPQLQSNHLKADELKRLIVVEVKSVNCEDIGAASQEQESKLIVHLRTIEFTAPHVKTP